MCCMGILHEWGIGKVGFINDLRGQTTCVAVRCVSVGDLGSFCASKQVLPSLSSLDKSHCNIVDVEPILALTNSQYPLCIQKVTWHHIYCVCTCIYSLLIYKHFL